MALDRSKVNYSLVLVLIIIFVAGSYFAISYYKKVKDLVSQSPNLSQNVVTNDVVNIDIDEDCDNTNRLTESLYTQDEVKSAKLVDENNCKLVLDDNTSFVYPVDWFIEYSKTSWKEVAFYYPEYDLDNGPPISFVGMNIEWQNSLQSSMLAHFNFLEQQKEIVTPLMLKDDVLSTRLDTFADKDVFEIIPKDESSRYGTIFYVFSFGNVNDIWLIKVNSQEFLDENRDVIELIVNSFSKDI